MVVTLIYFHREEGEVAMATPILLLEGRVEC